MANLNPLQMVSMLKNGNPRDLAEQIIKENFPNDPMMQNLLQMARQGNTQGLQQFAQNYFSQQGRDFNSEMTGLLNMLKGI